MKRLAIYLRLSLEDGNIGESGFGRDESNSISNQRKQIQQYIQGDSELSGYEAVEFCDDGCSGTSMDRPGMQKLLQEVRADHIGCIIVKDMSRFSRDYIEMGTYLNQIFPFMGIRFIAINDHYDSREHRGSTIQLDTAFQTLLYDLYSRDISVKVKTSLENKCAKGEYAFGQVPFGYEKSKEVKNALIVNEKEAEIVRYIFALAMQGKGSTWIAKQLYQENVPTITQMRRPEKMNMDDKVHTWSPQAVRSILNNRFYLGEMAYGKTLRRSVGSRKGIAVPREEWKVIRNHHEALISEDIYERVSSFGEDNSAKRKSTAKQNRRKHPLTGRLRCGGCGYAMVYKPFCQKNCCRRFECGKHALLQISDCCTYIRADLLEEAVLTLLNKELLLWGDGVRQRELLSSFQQAAGRLSKTKLEECRQEKMQIQAKKNALYESYALDAMGQAEYQKQSKKLSENLAALEKEYQKAEGDRERSSRYWHMEELTQQIADTFIKNVYVYKDKRVEIEWNFRVDAGRGNKCVK